MEDVLLEIAVATQEEEDEETSSETTSRQARCWAKSRSIVKSTRDLVSRALNLEHVLAITGSAHYYCQHQEMRRFLLLALPALENQQVVLLQDAALADHLPFWRLGNGYVPLPKLMSLRQAMSGAFAMFAFVRRGEILETARAFAQFVQRNVLDPTRVIFADLFLTPLPSSAQAELSVLEDAKESLQRMLQALSFSNASQVSLAFEREMLSPIRNTVFGDLVSIALVQVQILKVESLKLAFDLERILQDNKFNSQLLLALPSLFVAVQVVTQAYRFARYLLLPDEGFILLQRSNALAPVRLAFWELETLLIREDDGPALFSNVTDTQLLLGDEDWEDELHGAAAATTTQRQYARIVLAGQVVAKVHELRLLVDDGVKFALQDDLMFEKMRSDVEYLFPREGWSTQARIRLVQCLQRQVFK